MLTVLVDYDSGNLHSAEKAFQRIATESDAGEVLVSSRPEDVARADRIVLPGVGAFGDCRAGTLHQHFDAGAGVHRALLDGAHRRRADDRLPVASDHDAVAALPLTVAGKR